MNKTIMVANDVEVDRCKLLAALVNNARPVGLGGLNPSANRVMTSEDAAKIFEENGGRFYFDYVWGRPIKVFENDGKVDRTDLYDRDQQFFPSRSQYHALRDALSIWSQLLA